MKLLLQNFKNGCLKEKSSEVEQISGIVFRLSFNLCCKFSKDTAVDPHKLSKKCQQFKQRRVGAEFQTLQIKNLCYMSKCSNFRTLKPSGSCLFTSSVQKDLFLA